MHVWLEFWFLFFWIAIIAFIFNYSNFLFFFFYSEVVWLILYCLTTSAAIYTDDLNLVGLTFYFLGLAGLEFAIGFIILTILKNFKISLNLFQNEKNINFFYKSHKSTTVVDNYFWIK